MSSSKLETKSWAQVVTNLSLPASLRWAFAVLAGSLGLALLLLAHAVPPFNPILFGATTWIVALAVGLTSLHIRKVPIADLPTRVVEQILLLTASLTIAGVQIVVQALHLSQNTLLNTAYLAITPIVAMGLLIGALLGPRVALFATALPVMGLMFVGVLDPIVLGTAWIAAGFSAHAVTPLRQRSDVLRAAQGTIAAAGLASAAAAWYAGGPLPAIALSAGWGAIAGFVASCLFWLTVAFFERLFHIVSDWTLHELCSPEQPLLRELLVRAPGTYAHSVMVGNLAEQAASAIGANALLCRAMAYYHDIGKMNRPDFFIENSQGENPHERLSPSLSARVIEAHVKDGLELARQHKLPQPILDAIEQHHGTSLITYFYHKAARSRSPKEEVVEQSFRYAGPRPRTKEVAILMLADRVEAVSRTAPKQTPGRLRSMIWEIVQDVRDDGQLDDSDLHFRDLQLIVDSFVTTIGALRHERVPYPSENENALIEASDPNDQPNATEAQDQEAPSSDRSHA
jgi:putative nucleotidyltransferase with HDIG domain